MLSGAWNRLRRKKILFAALATLLFLATAELAIRALGLGKLPEERVFTDIYDPAYEMTPGAVNPWAELKEHLNDLGLRGGPVSLNKTPGTLRILCLGDSTTFGIGVPEPETFCRKLGERLNRRGLRVEAINAGVPGTNLWQQVMFFKKKLKALGPDLVVHYTTPNARTDLFCLRREMESHPGRSEAKSLFSNSHLYRFLRIRLRPPRVEIADRQFPATPDHGNVPYDYLVADTSADLTAMTRMCYSIMSRYLVLPEIPRDPLKAAREQNWHAGNPNFESLYRSLNVSPIVAKVAEWQGIYVARPEGTFLEESYRRELFLDDCHLNQDGHELMSKILEDVICYQRLLGQDCTNVPAD